MAQHRAHLTDPNNAQPPRHGVITRTLEGSLARSWPPPLPPLLRAAAAAAAANNCCAVASAVCRVDTFVHFVYVHASCSRVHQRAATKARSHQTNDRRLARCRAAATAACCCYCSRAYLMLLPIVVVLFLLVLCASFVYSVRDRARIELPRVSQGNGMRRDIYYTRYYVLL